ncbi:MAG: sodium:proton exchanger [Chloroflexi bacterium]|nr:sodium:proton exchanger [Chloroflexota bacterium]
MADFAIIMAAALGGGLLFYRLRLPTALGFILAGILIGPYSLEVVEDVEMIETMASVGVVLLLFTLGMEFSLGDLRRVGGIGLGGGTLQIVITAGLGFLVGRMLFGWSVTDATFFAFLIALSSTAIVVKILQERGETNTAHGRIMIAILLVQDLAVLPLMVVLPALGGEAGELARTVGIALGKAALFLGGMTVIGLWIVPRFLGETAGVRSRELFLLTVLAICLGAAYGTSYLGVSEAFGAFAAGMLISRSRFAHQALADVVPLRTAFAALFFVSLGLLGDPGYILDHLGMVLLAAAVIIVGKFVICSGITWSFGFTLKTTLFVGAGLTQVGEFSFVVGQAGLEAGVISTDLYSLILSSAIVSILCTPVVMKLTEMAYGRLSASGRLAVRRPPRVDQRLVGGGQEMSGHVIVCGHGRTGGNLVSVLKKYGILYVVVEINPGIVADLLAEGVPCIYGDAGNAQILDLAHVKEARVLALTCPDPLAETTASAYARQVNRDIDIVAVMADRSMAEQLRGIGISEVVEPALESSLEFVRHTLRYYGVADAEVEGLACPFIRQHGVEMDRQG